MSSLIHKLTGVVRGHWLGTDGVLTAPIQGCNSIDIFFGPEPGPEPGPSPVWSFETCLNLKCPKTAFGPEYSPVWHPGLVPKFKKSIELYPRALQGAFQGAQTPAFFTLTTKWLPESERARSFTFICTGAQFGTIVSLATSGLISYHIGWQYIFYIFASFGVLWSALVIFFVFESPSSHPRISQVLLHCCNFLCSPVKIFF